MLSAMVFTLSDELAVQELALEGGIQRKASQWFWDNIPLTLMILGPQEAGRHRLDLDRGC